VVERSVMTVGTGILFAYNEKARTRRASGVTVEITDYMLWKALVLVGLAFLWGLLRGFTGKSLEREPPDAPPVGGSDSRAGSERRP
jgi:hypothetical protein